MIELIDKFILAAVFFAIGYVACTYILTVKAKAIAKRYNAWFNKKR